MDRLDKKLLNLLQADASCTNTSLADKVGLSASTCLRRVARLKATGVIDRVVAILNPSKVGHGLKAIVTVELERHGEQQTQRFLNLASAEPAVVHAYSVSGQTDVILMLKLADMTESTRSANVSFEIAPMSLAITRPSSFAPQRKQPKSGCDKLIAKNKTARSTKLRTVCGPARH